MPGGLVTWRSTRPADIVEHAYERDGLPDWELVFELSRRATSVEASDAEQGPIGASRQG
jgi:hypothetical protein